MVPPGASCRRIGVVIVRLNVNGTLAPLLGDEELSGERSPAQALVRTAPGPVRRPAGRNRHRPASRKKSTARWIVVVARPALSCRRVGFHPADAPDLHGPFVPPGLAHKGPQPDRAPSPPAPQVMTLHCGRDHSIARPGHAEATSSG